MYYAEKPTSAHDIHELKVNLLGENFYFLTDAGVFSKRMIDYGSQVLLNTLDLEAGKTLLDIGCGYGPMGLALAKVQGVRATLVDINLRALALAQQNADKNGIDAHIFQSDLYEKIDSSFDYIISNPPIRAGKKIVHSIIEEGKEHLNSSGLLTIVIQKKQGAPSAKVKMQDVFGNCEVLKRDKGYYILQSEKI